MVDVTVGMASVFAVIVAALVLFASEPVPVDVTAIGVMVTLMASGPVTERLAAAGVIAGPVDLVTVGEGLSGFANPATVTVLAMFILSDGVQRTGVIQLLGAEIATYTGDSESRQLGATMGIVGPISGFINNTAAVAILLPMVADIAHAGRTSPSKLLIPLSYASMFGGMLTVIGTSTNILASAVAADLGVAGAPFSMFEFTALGAVVTVVGFLYLLTIGRYLIPERIAPAEDLTEEFRVSEYLTEVVVRENSPAAGRTVEAAFEDTPLDVDVVQLIRGDDVFIEPLARKTVRSGDVLALRTDRDTLVELLDAEGLDLLPEVEVDDTELEQAEGSQNLVELVVAPGSFLVGETLASVNFRQRYDATVLALRRGPELVRERMDHTRLRVGDTLLVQATADTVDRLNDNRNFIVAQEIERPNFRESKIPVAIGIVVLVVGAAALDLLPIVVAALAGAVAMVATRCLKPTEVYESIQWDVIFLLAGVIPLGIALTNTGGDQFVADLVIAAAGRLPLVGVLGLMYVITALLTNVISNNASVVLMIPVAVEVAGDLGASAFAFVLAVMFAASTAFMTPVGYQTNLFVYGPGGYRFADYLRVGTPLQLVFAVVTTAGIAVLYGL